MTEEFRLPNLLIAGCQKSGTTWLHHALAKSAAIFGSKVKELGYFNKPAAQRVQADYIRNFPVTARVEYYMESTPHYFQRPYGSVDTAQIIRAELGTPRVVVSFRNPVDRYESACIHHMMMGRIPYAETIDTIETEHKMLDLGFYADIARHWNAILPDIHYVFYDDIAERPTAVIAGIMEYLGLDNDIAPDDLDFRINDKTLKSRKLDDKWSVIPKLTPGARAELRDRYAASIADLGQMFGRDLSGWLSDDPATHREAS